MITDKSKGLTLHVKFFKTSDDEDQDGRLKVKIIKKAGNIADQYELTKELMVYLADAIIDEEDEE